MTKHILCDLSVMYHDQRWNSGDDTTTDWARYVSRPECLANGLLLKDKLLMIPGPTNIDPRVLQALSLPILAHVDQQFYQVWITC